MIKKNSDSMAATKYDLKTVLEKAARETHRGVMTDNKAIVEFKKRMGMIPPTLDAK